MLPPLLRALRPHQWTKNGAVFVGVVFARALFEREVMVPVALVFAAFCAAASAIYLVNDVRDREEDARHPVKCRRPIASGAVSVPTAWATAVVLTVLAYALAFLAGVPELEDASDSGLVYRLPVPPGIVAITAYLALNLAYNAGWKRVAITDVTCVAIGFLIRVVSGPAVAGLDVSSWLVLCTFFGALFLATAKRRGEMLAVESGTTEGRSVLRQYTPQILDVLLAMAASATLLSYSLYTVSERTVAHFGRPGSRALLYTVPFVFLGLGRYLILLYRRGEAEDPSTALIKDRGLLAAGFLWGVVVAVVLLFVAEDPGETDVNTP